MAPFNDSQRQRDRYDDDAGTGRSRGSDPSYDEFMPDGTHASIGGQQRTRAMFSRARDSVQRSISGASDYVKSHDMDDVLEEARTVARRNPRVAIVALLAVGFLVGRMLRRPR